ncbi:MAG: TetR/AcrR family transcriptional regulator [Chloroflexota bacterium]
MVTKHKDTAVRQREITSAARKLIIRHGSEHVTVREIAKAVGISEGAIYRHFKSKRDILSLLADDIEANLIGDIAKSSVNGCSSLEALDSTLRTHLSAIEKRRGTSFQVIAEIISLGDRKLNDKMSKILSRYIDSIAGLLVRGVKAGEVREDIDHQAAATLLFGMIQGLLNIWSLSNYSFSPEAKYEPLWHIFRQAVVKH